MRNVHGGCTVVFVDSDQEAASGRRQRTTLDLGGLLKCVVGILRELQQHAVGSIAVAPHQFVDPPPQERLVLRLFNELRQAVQGFSLGLEGLLPRVPARASFALALPL